MSVTASFHARCIAAALAIAWMPGCASPQGPGEPTREPSGSVSVATSTAPASAPASAPAPATAPASAPASASASASAPAPAPAPAIGAAEALDVLFPGARAEDLSPPCPAGGGDPIPCFLARRFPNDAEARGLAVDLYTSSGGVAGVERAHEMEGGFRGKIRIVPEPPVGQHRKHLSWVTAAATDMRWFFGELARRAGAPITYRHAPIAWRFFRSVGRTTPSAYAQGWTIAYNVSGSLNRNADAVRETLFHEIFHLNDGARSFSRRALGAIYDGIVARCGARTPCLAPYAPTTTMVRGGTYYAFQPDNGDGVHEYAAEIALRYYQDTRATLRGEPPARRPFRCGPPESAQAWSLVVGEFFGGVDLLPPC